MFDSLTDRLSDVFRKLGGRAQLTEANIQDALREVRLALLEADVNFMVVKEFTDRVREAALGVEVMKGVTPAQQVVKVVHDELVALLGGEDTELSLQGQTPAVILMAGASGFRQDDIVGQAGAASAQAQNEAPTWFRLTFTAPRPSISCARLPVNWTFPVSIPVRT